VVVEDSIEHIQIQDAATGANVNFRVEAIIGHVGPSTEQGHYITYGRQGVYDDENVTFDNGSAFQVLLQEGVHNNCYGYIYFLVESKDDNPERNNNRGYVNLTFQIFLLNAFIRMCCYYFLLSVLL
jgi:hypothetical protein